MRDGWRCFYCNSSQNLHPHHITFKSQGGPDELWNLLTLCMNCHRDVHDGKLLVSAPEGEMACRGNITIRRKQ
jgi:predicted HNH restriction endonuclease